MLKHALAVFLLLAVTYAANIIVNGKDTERTFDGIGGLSGGGATSRLLVDYEEPYRSQILDYLFKPNFGASLHILKVEIGGDTQTTDGTESSHMHFKDDLNFKRGYEFWLLTEAKKRNPDIITYGLSWGVPGWIGGGNFFSQDNIDYHVKWLQGVKSNYNIEIDYIGIWNERPYKADYIINLRKALDAAGLKTKIVAADGGWEIATDMKNNPELKAAVDVVGVHYPGTNSAADAKTLGNQLWASEDYSTYSNNVGSGCWARILNQNYVNGYMTSTISWNLVAAYYPDLPYKGDGLMWSWWPWSGSYVVSGTIWGSAHTTQFTKPGWKYLQHGSGVGHLPEGGSVVTLVPPEANGDFTMVIETMTHDNSVCIRPHLPAYTVKPQTVTFQLEALKSDEPLNVWYSHFSANESQVVYFKHSTITPKNGQITMQLGLDELITVTTMSGGVKGSYPTPPPAKSFPEKWSDDFESYPEFQEGKYFMDQTGVWEIYKSSKGNTMRQVVPEPPIKWCGESSQPISVIGDHTWRDMTVEFDALIETTGNVVAGARVAKGGCSNSYESGYYFKIDVNGAWSILSGTKTLKSGTLSFGANEWHNIRLNVSSSTISAYFDKNLVGTVSDSSHQNGWAAVGSSFDYTQFDNFVLTHAAESCGAGYNVELVSCSTDSPNANEWSFEDGNVKLSSNKTLCLGIVGKDPHTGSSNIGVSTCSKTQTQEWTMKGKTLINKSNGQCLDVDDATNSLCQNIETWPCNGGENQSWSLSGSQLITGMGSLCVGVGGSH